MGVVGRLDQYASMLAWEFDDYSMSENLLTYSTNFGVVWSSSLTLTLNNATAPDGTLTAAKIQRPINSGNSNITNSPTLLTNTDYCYSAFIKLASTSDSTYSVCSLSSSNGSISPVYASISYNFATGAISSFGSLPTISGVIPYPNGWYRLYMVINTSSQTNANLEIRPLSNNLVSDFYIWGAQLEKGSVATDYTPTTGTTINRVLPATTNTNITGLGTYYSSGFYENVGVTTFLNANVFAPYDPVYDEFSGTSFGVGQGRYMRQNTDKSVIVYNEIDEITDLFGRGIVRYGLVLDLDAGNTASYSGSGTTWTDLSASGNTGTLTNGPTYSSANGGSIVFDGVDDYVNCGSPSTLNFGTGNFNLSCWVNILSTSGADWIGIISRYVSGVGFWIQLNPGNRYVGFGWDGSNFITSSTSAGGGQWKFISCQRTGSTSAEVYVNGISVASSSSMPSGTSNGQQIDIGRIDIAGRYSAGNIAQVSIYNRALTAAEISQNYNALRGRYGL